MTESESVFTVWANGCSHVMADHKNGRESLGDAIRQSEGTSEDGAPPFDWDICLNLGDFSAAFGLPTEEEGREIVRQFKTLSMHPREAFYTICGNHDRNAPDEEPGFWFRKWIDPMGESSDLSGVHCEQYPYPVNGTWERYWFDVGNIRFLMMSDVNELSQAKGRGELRGNPGGVVSKDTFDWWVDQVESNRDDKIIVTAHHYVLKETTVASGEWEGMTKTVDGSWKTEYHGYYPEGTPNGASYLYWVSGQEDSGRFEQWLEKNPGSVDLWLGAHTHTNPDDTHGGKSHVEERYGGTTFVNVAALTRHFVKTHAMPISRILNFENGQDTVNVQCYMHTDEYRPIGIYKDKDTKVKLKKPFITG